MNTDYYFPTPIWWQDTNVDLQPLHELYSSLRKTDVGRQLSNYGGWQSNDILPNDNVETTEFVKYVETHSSKCIDDYGFAPNTKLELMNMWFSSNSNHGFNQVHNHAGAFLSGTFYLQVPKDAGEIVFYKNAYEEYITTGAAPIVQHTAISGSTCRYEARTGRVIMFPGYLQHAVMPTEGSDERVSLSFNMRIVNV